MPPRPTPALLLRTRLLAAFAVQAALVADARPASSEPAAAQRWTDETPDAMLEDAAARAAPKATPEPVALASLAVVAALADRATYGKAEAALQGIASNAAAAPALRDQARLLARMLAADEGSDAGVAADHALGVVDALAILGPFRDTGGGMGAHDGPEAPGATFTDARARYAWGSYDVAWRAVPRPFATAAGVPLDVFVFPRRESCTWVATKLVVPDDRTLIVSLAATGQARLEVDGAEVARDLAVHEASRFDRLSGRVRAKAGPHLVAAKVCSGALGDDGRVRLRVTDEAGSWPQGVTATADLEGSAPRASSRGRSQVDKRPTALGRSLEATDRSPDGRLAAAVLRTLGGADDSRSPRAPGLLSALADGALDPDRLALAAWIAPSGANRGAWYRRAAADRAIDARTRGFVQRRLVERHGEAGLWDWARAALAGAGIDTKSDPEAMLLAAHIDAALGTDALRWRAMERLRRTAGAADVPDAVLAELTRLAAGLAPAEAAGAAERRMARDDVDTDCVGAMAQRGGDAVLRAARRAFAGNLDSADDALDIAQAVAHTGAHDDARALYEQLSRWAPNRGAVWAGLAHESSAGPAEAMREETTLAALRRARELEPGEAGYRAELALRARAGAPTEPNDDEKYLVPAATILARRGAFAASASDPTHVPDVADRQLHWVRAVVMHPDHRISELVQYAREIVIAPRTEEELYEEIPAEGDLTEVVRARVHRADGGTAFPVEEANEDGRPRIKWPELAPGDVVEVAFRSWTAGPVGGRADPPFFRLDYAGGLSTHPVLYNEVDVDTPSDRAIHVDVINGKAEAREEKDEGGRHHLRLVWEHPAALPDEPYAPPPSETIPTVVISTFKDWSAFRSWYEEAVRGFTEPDAQVRELAAKLTASRPTRQGKLEALFDFVADDIRYVNYVSGERWLPNRPQQLLARREGDCDDKALLLITLLKAVGIDAEEVMVQTRLTAQPSVLRAPGASVPLFDHGIAFLPGPGGGTYLDATAPQSRLGPLPSMDARAVALRMTGPAEIVQLPPGSPDDHGAEATWTLSLAPDGSADLEGQERASGDDAFWMRSQLTEPGARAQWVEEHLIGGWFSTVQVDKKVDFQGDLARGGASMKWRARSTGLARNEGRELVLALSPTQTLAAELAPLVKRTLPVWLPPNLAPRKEVHTIRVVAPKGWSFGPLPEGGDEPGGSFGRARLELVRDPGNPRIVLAKRTMVIDQSVISVEEYPRWRTWLQRVDALMHKSVRLAPEAGAP